MTAAVLWQHVNRDDPHNSGWWVLARLIRGEDGSCLIETNTRGSVVSTEVPLPEDALEGLRRVLGTEERARLVEFLKGRRRDTLRALRASTDAGADYWRWQGHAELSRQVLELLGEDVPQ